MKTLYNYILLSALTLVFAGCINEEHRFHPSAETGDEVKFGVSLGDPKTKTVYGDEAEDGSAYPIYWVEGDKVQIFSPQCLTGRRSAEYKVVLPSGVTNPYYAEDLVKTGEYGVQWGENATADFYSLYPSGDYTLSSDGSKAENIVINYTQNISVNGSVVKSDMEDCLMYAKRTGVNKGETVNLHYDPISTVLMLTIKVAANETGTPEDSFTIQNIGLMASGETQIAGTFSINITDGKFAGFMGKSSKTIAAQIVDATTGGYYSLKNNGSVTIPLFLAPAEYGTITDWKVQVVANGNIYTKTLNIGKAFEPGQIHKITLPELKPSTTEWEVSKWMTYIPRNVYLSEVSIPGSWNSLNSDFQGTGSNISTQYNNGVRAFHLDCRWSTSQSKNALGILGLNDIDQSKVYLSVADGGGGFHIRERNWNLLSTSYGQMMNPNNPSFQTRLEQVVSNVKDDEYMVVFCSFAQESFNDVSKTGKTWMQAICDACDNINNSTDPTLKGRIFDGSKINANTVVGDVLGSVIVMVNCEDAIANIVLPVNSKCLFVNIPNNLTSDYFPSTGFKTDYLHTSSSTSSISMAVSQAQITSSTGSAIADGTRGYYPSFAQRTAVVNAILDWSKDNYGTANYDHDKWIYLGLGGLTGGSKSSDGDSGTAGTVLNTYAPLINGRIEAMGKNDVPYYPIGIVYMNYTVAGSYSSGDASTTIKNILMLNNKYRLQFDSSKPSDYNPNAVSAAEYGSTATVGGDAF